MPNIIRANLDLSLGGLPRAMYCTIRLGALRHAHYFTPSEAVELISNAPKKFKNTFEFNLVYITQNGTPSYSQRYRPTTEYRASTLKHLERNIQSVEHELNARYPDRLTSLADRLHFNEKNKFPIDMPDALDLLSCEERYPEPRLDSSVLIEMKRRFKRMSIAQRIEFIDVICDRLKKHGYLWNRRFYRRPGLECLNSKDKLARKVANSYTRMFTRYLQSIIITREGLPAFSQ